MGGKNGKLGFTPTVHTFQYDMIIIGGGSGGLACAREAAKLGARVAICDFVTPSPRGTQWGLGGTCVNVGCIPKRLMHQSSVIKDFISDGPLFGWQVPDDPKFNWKTLIDNVQDVIQSLNFSYKVVLAAEKVQLYKGFATFNDSNEVKITYADGKEDEMITAQCIVIAVGGRPKYLNIPGGTEKDNLCITSDDLFSLPYPPGKTICIGGGYIGTECAGFLAAYGFDVTIMSRSVLLREFDQEVVELITSNLIGRTVAVMTYVQPKEIIKVKDGNPPTLKVKYQFNDNAAIMEMECNTVLLAIGRHPCTKDLNIAASGVKMDDGGYILTNKYEATSEPHIFAIGDCAKDRPQLTPPAIQAGRFLAKRLFDKKFWKLVDYPNVPTAIFTPIEYGCCGLSEEEAIKKYGEKKVEVYEKRKGPLEFTLNKRDSEATEAKLICMKAKKGREKVVGFHCLGPNAAEITVGFSLAIKKQFDKEDFDEMVGIHPTVAEIFGEMKMRKSADKPYQTPGC